MIRDEAINYLEDAKIKIKIPKAAVTAKKTNEALEMAIKALKQEPCDDAVSREFLLRDLLLKAQGEKDVSIKWLEEYINSLPPVTPQEPRWIPVKERLPEKSGECLVTIKANPNNVCHLLNYRKPENYWTGKDIGKKSLASDDVLAWMPLPKPYKAESEEKE